MGGRPRTPTAELEARGAFIKHPERKRARANEPKVGPLGNVPRHLSAKQKEIWKECVDLLPAGVVSKSERLTIERLVRLVEKSRHVHTSKCEETCPGAWKSADEASLIRLLTELGMTPVSRTKVSAAPRESVEDIDPYEEFAGSKTTQ